MPRYLLIGGIDIVPTGVADPLSLSPLLKIWIRRCLPAYWHILRISYRSRILSYRVVDIHLYEDI